MPPHATLQDPPLESTREHNNWLLNFLETITQAYTCLPHPGVQTHGCVHTPTWLRFTWAAQLVHTGPCGRCEVKQTIRENLPRNWLASWRPSYVSALPFALRRGRQVSRLGNVFVVTLHCHASKHVRQLSWTTLKMDGLQSLVRYGQGKQWVSK